jgi:hypothetical protein
VCEVNAALAHHGNQIAIAQLEAQIPPHTQHHDLLVKMPTLEQLLDRYESWHPSIIVDTGCRLHQSPLPAELNAPKFLASPVHCEYGLLFDPAEGTQLEETCVWQ